MVIRHHLVVIYMLDIYQKFQKGKLDEDGDNKFPKYLPLSLVLVP